MPPRNDVLSPQTVIMRYQTMENQLNGNYVVNRPQWNIAASLLNNHLFPAAERQPYGPLSICNLIPVFPSLFPTLPRKISAYLQTDSPSGANTRIIRGFHKALKTNNLYSTAISSLCEKHHFGLRNGPYWSAIWCFSAPNMGFFAWQNGQYRNTVWMFSDYDTGYIIIPIAPERPLPCPI